MQKKCPSSSFKLDQFNGVLLIFAILKLKLPQHIIVF